MKRLVDDHLQEWKQKKDRKPLFIRGARQVGKTYSVRELGKKFDDFVEINFELNSQAALIFEKDLHPERILRELSLLVGRLIVPGKTLLFFDEIQVAPRAISSIRYFYELLPDLHLIAAGSLVDFSIEEFGLPVGRIVSLYMYPMSFIEFLYALDQELLAEEILTHDPKIPLSEPIHQRLLSLVGEYLAVGGMPEVVACWKRTHNLFDCTMLQQTLVDAYSQDFSRYAKKVQFKYLNLLLEYIPVRLGKKFKYNQVDSNYKKREFAPCLDLLVAAGLATKVAWSAGESIPLGKHSNPEDFKVLFLDVALSQTILGLDLSSWIINPMQQFRNKKEFVEAFVGQELPAYANPLKRVPLYYWRRAKRSSQAEIDYLLQLKEQVVPIKVKGGKETTLKSMHLFLKNHSDDVCGIRVSTHNYSEFQRIRTYPLYAVSKVVRS